MGARGLLNRPNTPPPRDASVGLVARVAIVACRLGGSLTFGAGAQILKTAPIGCALVTLLGALFPFGIAAGQTTVDEVRAAYRLARPKLEAIWDAPARYTVNASVKRWDISAEFTGKIQPESAMAFEIFGQKGRWRIDMTTVQGAGPSYKTSTVSTVSTKAGQFRATRKPGAQQYTISSAAGQTRLIEDAQRTIAGLTQVAFTLPTRVDVGDILLNPEYRITVVPTTDAQPVERQVTCAFERIQKSNPSDPITRLIFESGRITFLPERDWAIGEFTLRANTGLTMEGGVEYQQIKGINSRAVPKRVEFLSTETKSALKTRDVVELAAIVPGPIDDRVFSLSAFQLDSLNVKQSEGWNLTPILIESGVAIIVIALAVRMWFARDRSSAR
jgi:hypothetical protein